MYYNIKAAKPQYFFTIHYYLSLSKNPECEFSEEWKVNSEKVKSRTLSHSGFLAPQTGLEPVTLRLTVCCSLISIIFHASINFQKRLKTRGFWVSCKINTIYYSPYVYRFCSQICSQNNFTVLKAEPMTIRKIHLCSYIIKKIINLLSNPLEITGTPSDLLKRYCVPVTTTS